MRRPSSTTTQHAERLWGLGSSIDDSAIERDRRWTLRLEGFVVREAARWGRMAFPGANDDQRSRPQGLSITQETDNKIDSYAGLRGRSGSCRGALSLEGTFLGQKEQFHPYNSLPTPRSGPDSWRRATTWSVGADIYLLKQKLVLTAGERFESHHDEFTAPPRFPWLPPTSDGVIEHTADTPSFGLCWRPRAWIAVKANTGRYYRLPTFLELFGNTGSVTGNSRLEPERGENRDAGVVFNVAHIGALSSLFLEVSRFDNGQESDSLLPQLPYTSSRPIGSSRVLAGK